MTTESTTRNCVRCDAEFDTEGLQGRMKCPACWTAAMVLRWAPAAHKDGFDAGYEKGFDTGRRSMRNAQNRDAAQKGVSGPDIRQNPALSKRENEQALRLAKEGKSLEEIAAHFGVKTGRACEILGFAVTGGDKMKAVRLVGARYVAQVAAGEVVTVEPERAAPEAHPRPAATPPPWPSRAMPDSREATRPNRQPAAQISAEYAAFVDDEPEEVTW